MKFIIHRPFSKPCLSFLVLVLVAPQALATTCPSAAPLLPNAKITVMYDPADSSMKACVGSTWITLSGGGGGGSALDDLTDVVISSPAANQALVYNGTSWTNTTLTVTESDPQVGTLTGSKWCAANAGGTAVDCTQDAPSHGGLASGTAGRVQFSDGAGAFASDSNLVWDNTNKRLGIGTTSPAYALNSLGGFRISGSSGGHLWSERIDSEFDIIIPNGSTKRVLSLHASPTGSSGNLLELYGHNGTAFQLAMAVTNPGNVGIGTIPTTERLEVNGNIKANQFCNSAGVCVDPSSLVPTGAVMAFDLTNCPTGWTEYTAARGRFLRGIDNGAGVDPSGTRAPGHQQADDWKSFTMSSEYVTGGQYQHTAYMQKSVGSYPSMLPNFTGAWNVPASATRISWDNSEIRPKNVAVLYCRKN